MRRIWALCCVGVICVVFGRMAGWHEEAAIEVNEDLSRIQSVNGEAKRVALTFDDGPHPIHTARLLMGLKARGIEASFFVLGENAEKYPELIKQMAEDGHLIGNHTWNHVQLNAISSKDACEEIIATNQTIKEITGMTPMYLRPPFGEWNRKEDCPEQMISVYWDIDPLDWKTEDADIVARRILSEVEDGDIILLHDVYKTSVDAAFLIVDEMTALGYEFVSVEELYFD